MSKGPYQEKLEVNEPTLNFEYKESGIAKKDGRFSSYHQYIIYEEDVRGNRINARQIRVFT